MIRAQVTVTTHARVNRAAVDYVSVAASAVDYVLLVVAAATDSTGRFRLITDTAAVVDGVRFNFEKAPTSGVAPFDSLTQSVDKGLLDSAEVADLFIRVASYQRQFFDAADAADHIAKLFDKVANLRADSWGGAWGSSWGTAWYDDSLNRVRAADSLSADIAKNLADGVATNDTSSAFDGAAYTFSKGVANIVFSEDNNVINVGKAVSESAAATDAGLVVMQDYCDATYFADDYVGISVTF